MNVRKLITLAFTVFALILGVYYINLAVNYSRLHYSVSQCSSQHSRQSYNENQILNFSWDGIYTSKFDTFVTHNCNDGILGAKYKVLGDNIYIKYALRGCKECVKCICTTKVSYTLENIQKDSAYIFHHALYNPDFFEKIAFKIYNALNFDK